MGERNEQSVRGVFDVAIIGQGPAGLSAALYAARAGLAVAAFERLMCGGQMNSAEHLDNYPGFEQGVSPFELALAMQAQAVRFGAQMVSEDIVALEFQDEFWELRASSQARYRARSVIVATGARPRTLGLANEAALVGRGVSYCATCDGGFFRGKDVAVVGGGNTAVGEALALARLCRRVHLIHRRDTFRADALSVRALADHPNIELHLSSTVEALEESNGVVSGVRVSSLAGGEAETLAVSALFVAVGMRPASAILEGLGVELDAQGAVRADETGKTAVSGLFVAGDVRSKAHRQVVTAVSDGACAALAAFEYLSMRETV